MGNSIYWQLKYVDLVEDISVSENETEDWMSATEVFLLDVVGFIVACSGTPRKVVSRLPWFETMISSYPKVKKVYQAVSSSQFRELTDASSMNLPLTTVSLYLALHSNDAKKNDRKLLELLVEFFRLLGTVIYMDDLGNPLRKDEFLSLAEKLDSIRNDTYSVEELKKEYENR